MRALKAALELVNLLTQRRARNEPMRNTIRRICQLQPLYSASNTPEMKERGRLIRRELADSVRGLIPMLKRAFPQAVTDLDVSASDGIGRKTEAPWVRLFSKSRSPNPREGYYVVLHFAADGSAMFIAINCGSTVWTGGDLRPISDAELRRRTSWARAVICDKWETTAPFNDQIHLGATASLPRIFEKATVIAKRITVSELDSADLEELLFGASERLAEIYSAQTDGRDDFDATSRAQEVESIIRSNGSNGRTQGFGLSAEENRAIELRAMEVAGEHLRSLGYTCVNVSSSACFDYEARRGDELLKVEVKGTTADHCLGVLMTRNEVELHRNEIGSTGLILVTGIRLKRNSEGVTGHSGSVEAHIPWQFTEWEARPLTFQVYRPTY